MILNSYKPFLDEFFSLLSNTGIDASQFQLDHIAYYTASAEEYEQTVNELVALGWEKVAQNLVSERRVGLVQAAAPEAILHYKDEAISLLEVIEPLAGERTTSRWEHAELISSTLTLEDIIQSYPDLPWDTSRIDRKEFPMIKLRLSDTIQVKFPRQSTLTESLQQQSAQS